MNNLEQLRTIDQKEKKWRKIKPYFYLLPFALGVIIFTLYPIVNVVIT